MSGAASLTPDERQITMELANLTGGPAASTLAMLIDQTIDFGQPQLEEWANVAELSASPLVANTVVACVSYSGGFNFPVVFALDATVCQNMANIMMGGSSSEGAEGISDIEMGAIGEVISQMMAVIANNMSQFLGISVDISPPDVQLFSPEVMAQYMPEGGEVPLASVAYPITNCPTLGDCTLTQIMPVEGLRQQVHAARMAAPAADEASLVGVGSGKKDDFPGFEYSGVQNSDYEFQEGGGTIHVNRAGSDPVTVQPVKFPSFDAHTSSYGAMNTNLELVMDVCLNLTVELGRTELSIKEVLELTRGSVIELNRVAGESVDLYANGKMIAKGEVVVIEDNFGLRITSIVSPADRLRGL